MIIGPVAGRACRTAFAAALGWAVRAVAGRFGASAAFGAGVSSGGSAAWTGRSACVVTSSNLSVRVLR